MALNQDQKDSNRVFLESVNVGVDLGVITNTLIANNATSPTVLANAIRDVAVDNGTGHAHQDFKETLNRIHNAIILAGQVGTIPTPTGVTTVAGLRALFTTADSSLSATQRQGVWGE